MNSPDLSKLPPVELADPNAIQRAETAPMERVEVPMPTGPTVPFLCRATRKGTTDVYYRPLFSMS